MVADFSYSISRIYTIPTLSITFYQKQKMALDSPSPIRYRPELNWLQIVYSEIVSVTNAMRRNQRWNQQQQFSRSSSGTTSTKPLMGSKEWTGVDQLVQFMKFTEDSRSRQVANQGAPLPPPAVFRLN